jgi:hypothetical protein
MDIVHGSTQVTICRTENFTDFEKQGSQWLTASGELAEAAAIKAHHWHDGTRPYADPHFLCVTRRPVNKPIQHTVALLWLHQNRSTASGAITNSGVTNDYKICFNIRTRDSSVSIGTNIWAVRKGIDSRRGQRFLLATASIPALGPTQPTIQRVLGLPPKGMKNAWSNTSNTSYALM